MTVAPAGTTDRPTGLPAPSVPEMPHPGKHHRQPGRIRRRDHLRIADRPARLDYRRRPGRNRDFQPIREREEGVGRHHTAPGQPLRQPGRFGGFLAQTRDAGRVAAGALQVVTKRAPSDAEMADLLFAFRVCKHVKSNAIVYAKDGATVGIGGGQPNRVDSARIAAWKSEEAAKTAGLPERLTRGSVVASDAFFPFADGLEVAVSAGATAVIQPGGSIRDAEVIAAADAAGLAMVFTGMRHFRH